MDLAREQLRRGFDIAGQPPTWDEHDTASDTAPTRVRGFGSPTILVNGRDVAVAAAASGASCRVYPESDVQGAPSLDAIVSALRADTAAKTAGIFRGIAVVPSAILSALPVVACPTCWPGYAGALSALGVPFLMDAAWLVPLTGVALLLALGSLGFRARARRGFGPFAVGGIAAVAILAGKVFLENNAIAYVGTALLVIASVWNSWPRKSSGRNDCESCASIDAIARPSSFVHSTSRRGTPALSSSRSNE